MQQGQRTDLQPSANLQKVEPAISRAKAAKIFNVSERSVNTAKAVLKTGIPELQQAVQDDKIKVSKAAKIATC